MSQQSHRQVNVDTEFIGEAFSLWTSKFVLYIGCAEVTCREGEVIRDVEVSYI